MEALALVDMFLLFVVRSHGLPESILSDRGTQFVSELWTGREDESKPGMVSKSLCELPAGRLGNPSS